MPPIAGTADEPRQTRFRADHRAHAAVDLQALRCSLRRRAQGQALLSSRPISVHSICATHMERELARSKPACEHTARSSIISVSAAMLDLRGSIPSFIFISDGKFHDVNVLDHLVPEPGAFYVMDRAYIDFERLARLNDAGSFFVTRAKSNFKAQRRYSRAVDRATGLVCDQTVMLTGFYSRKGFEAPLRRIKFNDPETGKRLVFLTNNL